MSLFVPHVHTKITKEKIASIFLRFGQIDRIDLVPKKTGDKQPHNAAYIRFSRWHDTMSNREFQQELTNGAMKAHLTYDDKWYWIVLENKRIEKALPPTPMSSPNTSPATPLSAAPLSAAPLSAAPSPKTPPPRNKMSPVPGAPKRPPKKKFENLNQIARLQENDDEKHIAQDLFGDDTSDLVDASYVYYMECEVHQLRLEIQRLNQMNSDLMCRNLY